MQLERFWRRKKRKPVVINGYDFDHKSCILDTNILNAFVGKGKGSEKFRPVLEFLKNNNVSLFILEGTKFEFVGYSSNKKDYEKLNSWITSFPNFVVAPTLKDDFSLASKLSAMYRCKNPNINPKQVSFVDCLHAAQLCRYRDRAFIVTTDLNDYPSFLFKMPHSIPIEEEGGSTFFVGFKTLDEDKWKILQADFEKSG